jgi:hypothetical protein
MPATPAPSVPDLRAQFERVLSSITSEEAQTVSADAMERHLLGQLLALGRALFALFLATRAAATAGEADRDPAGVERPYHDERTRPYLSIFGRVAVTRPYFYRKGVGGRAPVDALLALPPTVCSDLVRETAEELGVDEAYHKGLGVLRRLLGLRLSTRTLHEQVAEDAPAVEAFYAQRAPPPAEGEAPILVLQADGKGVPIRRPRASASAPGAPGAVRRGKGQKRGGKKEATLTAVYTIAPTVRTPEEVVESLFRDRAAERGAGDAARDAREGPRHKRLWATLAGKDAALAEAAAQVARRDGPHIAHRVALTDGSQALQERVGRHFPAYTLVLDLIHATEYLWKAANALLGEANPRRTAWVKARTLQLLRSQGAAVVADLRTLAAAAGRPRRVRTALTKVAAYLERNAPYLDYATYLARGWPIATGVIEGACRHLVKDRCELSGMRWTIVGAEALLHLRCVQENGDWDAFHAFRRRQRHQRLYAEPYPDDATAPPDLRALEPGTVPPPALAA